MTALENVLVGMHARLKANLFNSILRTPNVRREEKESRERAFELLEEVGLRREGVRGARRTCPTATSGGSRSRARSRPSRSCCSSTSRPPA